MQQPLKDTTTAALGSAMTDMSTSSLDSTTQRHCVPYDENLLERSRTQWQIGDWESLASITRERLQHHPDRAKLALLVASGHAQIGNIDTARQFTKLAKDWGCAKTLISQMLIAGVQNCLGRCYLILKQDQKTLVHFEKSIDLAAPKANKKLFIEARAVREAAHLGLLPQAANFFNGQLAAVKTSLTNDRATIKILESELELLHVELSLAQQRHQIYHHSLAIQINHPEQGSEQWQEVLRRKSVAQLGQDLWVLERTGYKRDGYFVEFGATDGVLLSNTWLLEKEFGWQGICAEPNPKFFEKLQRNRSCQVSNQYIGRVTGETITFVLADAYGGSQEFADSDLHKDKRDAYTAAGHVATFTSISLDDFLQQHGAPRDIDYISVDTEGSEYDLLSSFPFDKWNVHLFTIEHNFSDQREQIRQLLEQHGYRRTERQWDDWYER